MQRFPRSFTYALRWKRSLALHSPTLTDAENEPPQRRPRARHRELLAAIASGFVGALALATSTYNVYLQRQQLRAAVLPRLVLNTDFSDDGLVLALKNRGVGPAEVSRVRVTVDGKPAHDWIDAETRLLHTNHLDYVPPIETIEGQTVSPGLEITPFRIPKFEDAASFLLQRRRLAIEICYCSTLDDCWLLISANDKPATTQPTAACTPDPEPFQSIADQDIDTMLRQLLSPDGGAPIDGGSGAGAPGKRLDGGRRD